jgi:hypothetical protein
MAVLGHGNGGCIQKILRMWKVLLPMPWLLKSGLKKPILRTATEKDDKDSTHLYSLSEYKVRPDLKVDKGYR